MGAYRYQALDGGGRTRRGIVEGESPRHVRDQLREQGLTPLEVEPYAGGVEGLAGVSTAPALSGAERALVLRQAATLVRAGLPLEEVLGTISEQAGHGNTSAIFAALRARVREGHDLAESMRAFPRAFTPEVLAAVAAGERSGALDTALERLADFAEQRQGLGRDIMFSLLYPLIVVAVAIAVIVALMSTVVPRVVRVFEHAGQELPGLTRALIATSGFLTEHSLLVTCLLVALPVLLVFAWRYPAGRARLQSALLSIPLLGRAMRAAAAARFCRSLALQVASSVPLVEALQVAREATGLSELRRRLARVAQEVHEGSSLEAALRSGAVFPPLVSRLLASGERTGRLADMLERAAEAQEIEAASLARTLSTLLQPVMILLVGLFVLLVVLAVMLPILNMNQLLA